MATLYALVDGAQDRRIYGLISRESEHTSLLGGSLEATQLRASPFLVRLEQNSQLARAWHAEGHGRNWGIHCVSSASLSDLRSFFRGFLQAKLPDGQTALFRFWDPRVWRAYLPACEPDITEQWFRRVDEYRCEGSDGQQTMRYLLRNRGLTVVRTTEQLP